jgi:serine/threonine-protein kinase
MALRNDLLDESAHVSRQDERVVTHCIGDTIDDKYELIELIGSGGMGTVWRARDCVLDIDVALKLVRSRETPAALDRLLREARAAASITHPSIVRILSFGLRGEDAYITMELLEGTTLEDLLIRLQVLAPREAVELLLPIARALEAAHERGVIHRDVKPGNILLAEAENGDLCPKLLDFGIARADEQLPSRLTVTGQVMGTPHYMSPEQAAGRDDVDHRADIWGVCAVLYEAISGAPPFDADNYNALISAVLLHPVPPLSKVANVDEQLSAVVQRGLEKKRERRYASAGELADAMEEWLACAERPTAVDPESMRMTEVTEVRDTFADQTRPRRASLAPQAPIMGLAALAVVAIAALVHGSIIAQVGAPTLAAAARSMPGAIAQAAPSEPTEPAHFSGLAALSEQVACQPAPAPDRIPPKPGTIAKERRSGALPLPLEPEF